MAFNYSSTAEVVALTRMHLVGEITFNTTTLPTATEVSKFINRAGAVLDVALANAGFSTPVTQETAKLACDEWVTLMAAQLVELSQPLTEWESGKSRAAFFGSLPGKASEFVSENDLGFKNLGVPTSDPVGQGVIFTGQEAQKDRADPQDSSLEQPKFTRGQFDA